MKKCIEKLQEATNHYQPEYSLSKVETITQNKHCFFTYIGNSKNLFNATSFKNTLSKGNCKLLALS